MRTPHLSCRQGKKIKMQLRNGETIIDRFKEKKGRYIIFENHKIPKSNIKNFTIIKGITFENY